jgi:hypothetical protein
MRSSSGGSGERRLGVRAIPAEGSRGLGWVKSRSWGRGWGSSCSSEFGRGGAIGENPGEEQRRRLGVARRKKGQCSWRERECGRVCSSTWFAEEKEKEREKGWSRLRPGRWAARWRPASAREHRGARKARQQGSARAAGRGRVTRGERAGRR